jgi:hypothetical protein
MHDAVCQSGQATQGLRLVQIAQQGHATFGTQFIDSLGAGSQHQKAKVFGGFVDHTHTNIAAADDQQALAFESGRQCAERGLV